MNATKTAATLATFFRFASPTTLVGIVQDIESALGDVPGDDADGDALRELAFAELVAIVGKEEALDMLVLYHPLCD